MRLTRGWHTGWEENDKLQQRKEPNTVPANCLRLLFLGARPYRRLWDFFLISFQHRFMAGGSRGPAAPTDPLKSFGLRQETPAPSWGGAGAVAAALTWTETQTSCDPRSVPHTGLHQAKDGTNVKKGRESLVPGYVWGGVLDKGRLRGSVHCKVLSWHRSVTLNCWLLSFFSYYCKFYQDYLLSR